MEKKLRKIGLRISLSVVSLLAALIICAETIAQDVEVASKRMAAFHYSVVTTGTEMPSSAVLTYPVNEFRVQTYNFLLKLMPVLNVNGKMVYPSEFEKVNVKDFPGGNEAEFSYQGYSVKTRITPLLTGRGSDTWGGAVVYEVETDEPDTEVMLLLGGGDVINLIWGFDSSVMKKDSVYPLKDLKRINDRGIRFSGGKEKLHVGIKASEEIIITDMEQSAPEVKIRIPGGKAHLLVAFSEDANNLSKLIKLNAMNEKQKVVDYYENLLSSYIETPERVMNDAFASAIYNLEYSWIEPFGWGECLHHWLALWYMQVTAAADWLGQEDRSRSSILEHGLKQFENGAIPMFNPNHLKLGMKRRDWGGGNNYWIWQIRHYINQTGDRDFAELIIPYVDKTIQQTLEEYDKDGNDLIAWGLQIGNQEDFVANPYNGSVPSIELYNMYSTRSELAEFIGDHASAELWAKRAEKVKQLIYDEFWLKDLGRFSYYKDPTERILPDGQYQTYLYPAIYNIVDRYDQYSGIRHLLDRLTDENGAVFASNNFAFHVPESVSTWGMQRGAAQQPWAAMGFSETGMNNRTWLPLKAMAEWAQDPRRPGAWPETGPEITPAYFTPPAGLYISTTIENLFGLKVNKPGNFIEVSPSFPDHWPGAKLNLPGYKVEYSKQDNHINYHLETIENLPINLRWRLPVSAIRKCTVNGRETDYKLSPGVDHVILSLDIPPGKKTHISIEYEHVDFEVDAPLSVAEGEPLSIDVSGVSITKVTDRSGILESYNLVNSSRLTGRVSRGLLDSYRDFNQLGQLNFSRRTFFLDCITEDGIEFIFPVDICILPRLNATAEATVSRDDSGLTIPVLLRNNTGEDIEVEAWIEINNKNFLREVDIPSRSERSYNFNFPSDPDLTAGDNSFTVMVPDEDPLEIFFSHGVVPDNSSFMPLELPLEKMIPDTRWNTLRIMPGFPHIFFTFSDARWPEPMWALENEKSISVEEIPGLSFQLPGRRFIPVSHKSGNTSFRLDLEKHKYRKIYLLVIPFVDNHDIFSEVGRVSVYSGDRAVQGKTLHYPGDVDYWVPDKNPTSFSTYREPRDNRFEMLPLLAGNKGDWKEGTPPEFPQSKWWSASRVVETESCLMNVIEIKLDSAMELDYLVFESLGALPAFGIVAATAEIVSE